MPNIVSLRIVLFRKGVKRPGFRPLPFLNHRIYRRVFAAVLFCRNMNLILLSEFFALSLFSDYYIIEFEIIFQYIYGQE